jgi:hypothetical protein
MLNSECHSSLFRTIEILLHFSPHTKHSSVGFVTWPHQLKQDKNYHCISDTIFSGSLLSISVLHHQSDRTDDGGSTHLWNVSLLQRDYTVIYRIKLSSPSSPPLDPDMPIYLFASGQLKQHFENCCYRPHYPFVYISLLQLLTQCYFGVGRSKNERMHPNFCYYKL